MKWNWRMWSPKHISDSIYVHHHHHHHLHIWINLRFNSKCLHNCRGARLNSFRDYDVMMLLLWTTVCALVIGRKLWQQMFWQFWTKHKCVCVRVCVWINSSQVILRFVSRQPYGWTIEYGRLDGGIKRERTKQWPKMNELFVNMRTKYTNRRFALIIKPKMEVVVFVVDQRLGTDGLCMITPTHTHTHAGTGLIRSGKQKSVNPCLDTHKY